MWTCVDAESLLLAGCLFPEKARLLEKPNMMASSHSGLLLEVPVESMIHRAYRVIWGYIGKMEKKLETAV